MAASDPVPCCDAHTIREVEWLLTEWAYLIDHGRAVEVVDLFVDEGVFESAGVRSAGRDALRDRFAQRQARPRTSRHVWSNLRLTPISADELRGEAILVVYRHDGPGVGSTTPARVLDVCDRYRRIEGRWRIAERVLVRVFEDAVRP